MKIALFDAKKYEQRVFIRANKGMHEIHFFSPRLTLKSLYHAKGFTAVCTFVNCEGSRKVLEGLKKLGVKYWFQRSAGYDNINLKAAAELGIKVYRVPRYSPESVAEFAMTLILAINRNIQIAYGRTKVKNFSLEGLEGDTIYNRTVGVLGAGKTGQAFIKIAKGFGATVIVYDDFIKEKNPKLAEDLGFTFVTKEEVFKKSDYLSLHLPLTSTTAYIVNEDTLKLMKKNAIIVNTSRGELINTKDLLHFLDYGYIRGAGLDVYEKERGIFFYDHSNDLIQDSVLNRLRAHRNVILTSHQAFFTNAALKQIAKITLDNVNNALNNKKSKTEIYYENKKIVNG